MASDALGVRASAGRALLGGSASPSDDAEEAAADDAADGVPMSSALRLREALGVAAAAASRSALIFRGRGDGWRLVKSRPGGVRKRARGRGFLDVG